MRLTVWKRRQVGRDDRAQKEGKQSPDNSTPTCRLLTLPTELKNRIYRLSVCEDDQITLGDQHSDHRNHPPRPLSTCTQIRSEATSIYYLDNTFTVYAVGFNPDAVLSIEASARKHVAVSKIAYAVYTYQFLRFDTKYSWSGLVRWLKAYYDGKAEALVAGDPIGVMRRSDGYAIAVPDMVGRMKRLAMRWEDVEKMMDCIKVTSGRAVKWA